MSKSEFLKKMLAVGLSVMSCVPAVGATGSYNEEQSKIQIKKKSNIKKVLVAGAVGTGVVITAGVALHKLLSSEDTEKQNNQEIKSEKSNIQNQSSGKPEQVEVNTVNQISKESKPEEKVTPVQDDKKPKIEKKVTPSQDKKKPKIEKKVTPVQDDKKPKIEKKVTPIQDEKKPEVENKVTPNKDEKEPETEDRYSPRESLGIVVSLFGQKKAREYVEKNSSRNPRVKALNYMFKVLGRKEMYNKRRFDHALRCFGSNLFKNGKCIDQGVGAFISSECPILYAFEKKSVASLVRIYDKYEDCLSDKDGFDVEYVVSEGSVLKEFEEISLGNGKEYELTACTFKIGLVGDLFAVIKQDGKWYAYFLDGKCEVVSEEEFKEASTRLPTCLIKLTYSVK